MKKLIRIIAVSILIVMTLTSCLRDATPISHPTETEAETTHGVSESLPVPTESQVSEPEVKEPVLHAEVVKWTAKHEDATAVLMNPDEIAEENRRMMSESHALFDVLDFKDYMTGDEIRTLVCENDVPTLPRYDKDDTEITEEHAQSIRVNMAVERIADGSEVLRGIIVSRSNVRAVPDDKPYRKAKDNPYDSIQKTELCVGTPVWVIHTSLDGEYLFVIAYNYYGWVKSTDVAVTRDDSLWRSFADPENFVCITDALLTLSGEFVDMGATFPLVSEVTGGFTVKVPKRDVNGQLVSSESFVSYYQGCIGYLPYTYENYLIQAFKYEGTMYGWGGLDNGVDCSSFVGNVFRTFGFKFPRDTKEQNSVVGSAIDVSSLKHADVSDILLQSSCPTAVYYTGHTLLFLGFNESDRRFYFIHAPQIGEKVSVTSKKDLSGITFIGHVGEND